jgi:uncharacterized phage protein gp47/JayE
MTGMALIEEITYESVLEEMLAAYEAEAGFAPDEASDISIRLRVLASQIHSAAETGKWLLRQMFFSTAEGEYLDRHAGLQGISRNVGSCAEGRVTFRLAGKLGYDVTIPEGLVCATSDAEPIRYLVVSGGSIPAGSYETTLDVVAEEPGVAGNIKSGRVSVVVSPPSAGMTCRNSFAFSGGSDREDDETLRERIASALQEPSNGTNAAFYVSEALKVSGVQSAVAVPRADGRGTVSVYAAGVGKTADSTMLAAISARLDSLREINVDVSVLAATEREIPVSIKIKPSDGYLFSEISAACYAAVTDYFNHLMIGESFRLNRLGNMLLACEGVEDYTFLAPTSNISVASTALGVPGNITVAEWVE